MWPEAGGRKRDDDRVLVAASSQSHRGRWEPALTTGSGQGYKSHNHVMHNGLCKSVNGEREQSSVNQDDQYLK